MIQRIRESDFIRNIFVLFSGSLLSQVIPFIALPFLQKYFYTPADFGLLAIFISFCELFANVATCKLEYGIVIQSRMKNAINILYGAIRVMLLMMVISAVIALIFKRELANYFGEPRLENYMILLPVYVLVFSLSEIGSYWFNRKKSFKIISFSKIIQTSSSESIKFIAGFLNFGPIGLIIGRVSGFFFANLYYLRIFFKRDRKTLSLISKKQSNQMIQENRKFIFFTTPSVFIGNLINVVYLQLFLIYFGEDIVGMIGVSMTYLSAGFGVVAISFSQVFYSKVAETKSKERLLEMYKRFAKNLMLLAFVPIVLVYAIPASWVAQLLGDKWLHLMDIARIMVLWLAVWFVSSSLSFIYMRLRKQQVMMIYDFIHLILIVIGFFAGYWIKMSLNSALWGFTIAQIVFYSFVIYIAIYFIKRTDESKL
jgi:lipopolysaccharide exporter